MTHIVRSLFAQWFSRSEKILNRHLTAPRTSLYDTERQLSRQLRTHFRQQRRAA